MPSALDVPQRGSCAQNTVSERARLSACVRAMPSNCHAHPLRPPRLTPPSPLPLPARTAFSQLRSSSAPP
eukprot:3548137-Prymnesium_polylepis.1